MYTEDKAINWIVKFWDYLDVEFDNYLCEAENNYDLENPFRKTETFVLCIVIQIVTEKLRNNFAGDEWKNFTYDDSKLALIKSCFLNF